MIGLRINQTATTVATIVLSTAIWALFEKLVLLRIYNLRWFPADLTTDIRPHQRSGMGTKVGHGDIGQAWGQRPGDITPTKGQPWGHGVTTHMVLILFTFGVWKMVVAAAGVEV